MILWFCRSNQLKINVILFSLEKYDFEEKQEKMKKVTLSKESMNLLNHTG